ncbi:MAG: pilus assembly protein PilM [Deltaproteobacteria bacterium]|nr:pilus assembly protein PilM [Deltaproteobacteria bacterium]
MLFQTSLGVDIWEDELCLACLKASPRDVQLLAHAVYPFEEGISDEEKTNAISGLIQRFIRDSQISPAAVFLGIPRNAAILRYLEFPIAVKENLRESLGYELEKYVPFSPEDIYFDFQIISEDKTAGRLQLLLVVVKKQTLSPDVGISGVEISSTALAGFFFRRGEKDGATPESFIYMRGRDLELGLVKDGMLRYSRGLSRREDLMAVLPAALGKMRQDFGAGDEPLDTVFCGMETDVPLLERLRGVNGINIRLLDLSRDQIPSTAVIAAYGLALKGVRKTAININLLPPALRKKPSKFKRYTLFGLAALMLLGALAWGGGVFFQRQWALDRLAEKIERLGAQLKKIEGVKAEKKGIEDRIHYLNTLRRGGPSVLDILKELSERIPRDAWVNKFDFSENGVQIGGYATSASELIPLLDASPMFSGVKFLSAINKDRRGKERFRIGLSLR